MGAGSGESRGGVTYNETEGDLTIIFTQMAPHTSDVTRIVLDWKGAFGVRTLARKLQAELFLHLF